MRRIFLIFALLLPICVFARFSNTVERCGVELQQPNKPEGVDGLQEGSILINEVMADPKGSMYPEYIELYNTTEQSVSLKGCLLWVGTRKRELSAVTLSAKGYAVLYSSELSMICAPSAVKVPIESFLPLNNKGKTLQLTNASGLLIDKISYGKAKPGVSWERSADGFHLCSAEEGGTPGAKNSSGEVKPDPTPKPEPDEPDPDPTPEPEQPDEPTEGSILINEVMADPKGSIYPEYIELYNPTEKSFSLEGLLFWVGRRKRTLPAVTLSAKGYAVLYSSELSMICAPSAVKVPIESFLPLNNKGQTLQLANASGLLIDTISYGKAKPGVSWERSEEGFHLCSAKSGGTPGAKNSSGEVKPDPTPKPEPDEPNPDPTPEPDKPDEPAEGSLLINEVMADPNGSMYPEYIELYNPTEKAFSLENLLFWVGSRKRALPAVTLSAKGYAVLYSSELSMICAASAIKIPIESFLPLNNSGQTLQLTNSSGLLIDKISYGKAKPGVSWERSEEGFHLCSAESGGTPGAKNSSGEVKPDPTPKPEPDEPNPDPTPEPDKPDEPAEGSILINEVMADPNGSMYPEYIELYNPTEKSFSLEDLLFWVGTRKRELPAVSLSAKGYAVLYSSELSMICAASAVKVPIESFLPLNNSGKTLQLTNSSGLLIDKISYGKAKPGVSWERSEEGFHLCSAESGGTPGAKNSSGEVKPDPTPKPEPEEPDPDPTPEPDKPDKPEITGDTNIASGEILFSELLVNPYTDGSEYIELYNHTDRPLSLAGLSLAIRKRDGNLGTHYTLSSITEPIGPKGYVVLSKSVAGVEDFYLVKDASCLYELNLPVLPNTASDIVLFHSKTFEVIDEVCYSVLWHAPSIKDEKGVALERISYERPTQDRDNWTSAAESAGYGTPGYANSQHDLFGEGDELLGIESPIYSDWTGDYTISYLLDQAGYSCRAYVFDTSGRRVAEIANHVLLGTKGKLSWNGRGADGGSLTQGLYIFYVELYHPKGITKRYKKIFLVH